MAADTLVIVVTWASTYRIGKASRDARLGFSFGTLLLRDGELPTPDFSWVGYDAGC